MDHNDETKLDSNNNSKQQETEATTAKKAENRGVSWADGSFRSTDSTEESSRRRHAKEDHHQPLNQKFSEEGSTVAAVMDAIIVSSTGATSCVTTTTNSTTISGNTTDSNSTTRVRASNSHSENNSTSTNSTNNNINPPQPLQPPQVIHDPINSTSTQATMAPNELSVAVIMPEESDDDNHNGDSGMLRVQSSSSSAPPADVTRALLIGSGSKDDASCATFVTDDEDDDHRDLEDERSNNSSNNNNVGDVELAPTFSSSSTDSTTTIPIAPHEQPPPIFVSPSCRAISSDEDDDDASTAAEDSAAAMFYAPPSFGLSHSSDDDDSLAAGGGAVAFASSQGIILPPSLRNKHRTNIVTPTAAETATMNTTPTPTTRVHHSGCAEAATQLLSLPIDSLHCVASFLTPLEWAQYGQTCSAANKVGREIFRRVRMHGFKCATEVVTAWKLDQHADAKELSALYISAGVPIYPYSLGHSYHTICWRMGIEAKQMQQRRAAAAAAAANPSATNVNTNTNTNATTTNNEGEEDQTAANVVDRFQHDRSVRARDANNPLCSYLEEKAMFTLGPSHHLHPQNPQNSPSPLHGRWNSMTSLQGAAQRAAAAAAADANMAALPPQQGAAAGAAVQLPDFRPPALVPPSPLSMASAASSFSSPPRSMSQTELVAMSKAPKVPVPVHRHLLDQHLLGRSSVDDEEGIMTAPPVSLSVDFFHPHLSAHCISGHSRPLSIVQQQQQYSPMQVPLTPPRLVGPAMAAAGTTAAAATTTTSNEEILRDPAFQEWASRAVANTNNRFSVLDDAEELRELHEVYSQIFDQERMGQAGAQGNAASAAANLAQADQSAFSILPPPRPILRAVSTPQQNSLAEVSLEESLLSTVLPRQGYSSILNSVDLEVYSASKANLKENETGVADMKRQMRSRFTFYHRRLEVLLMHGDSSGYEECILDFWDEFFPLTAKIHYYDRHTPVPRISSLQQFLTQPCPKEIGIVQCEIERVKSTSRKRKGVSMKGRLFPTYEYRLFIKDREHGKIPASSSSDEEEEDNGIRRDTVLMVAKNRGRKHVDTSGVVSLTPAAKKGANNYYLYTPQQTDVDTHFNSVNEAEEEATGNHNGVSLSGPSAPANNTNPVLLGRLQSNFIGTEFQIYTPKLRKNLPKPIRRCASLNEGASSYDDDGDYDSGAASDTGTSFRPRRSRFGRLTLRRSSSHAATPANSSDHSLPMTRKSRSSRSRHEAAGVRGSRTNRRAIANSTEAPENTNRSPINQEPILCEEEDGVITYTANLLGSRPRIMDVCVPKLSPDGGAESIWRNYLENSEDGDDIAPYNRMLNCFKQLQQRLDTQTANDNEGDGENNNNAGQNDFGLMALQNRPPWWNVELGSFVLNFRGRVSVASVKNFQLCDRNDHDHIMLQFGRIAGRHSFTMDYQYPLTAVQAFSIAISSLQSKISFG